MNGCLPAKCTQMAPAESFILSSSKSSMDRGKGLPAFMAKMCGVQNVTPCLKWPSSSTTYSSYALLSRQARDLALRYLASFTWWCWGSGIWVVSPDDFGARDRTQGWGLEGPRKMWLCILWLVSCLAGTLGHGLNLICNGGLKPEISYVGRNLGP